MSGATYAYRAARADGVLEAGTLWAESREAAAVVLSGRGLFPVEIAPERSRLTPRARLSSADLALGLRVLATLLESGLPVGRALDALDALVPASWRDALPAIRAAIREGRSLGAALTESPIAIPSVAVGIIRAGEAGSGLPQAVRRAADLMESTAATRAAIRSALAYPLVLAIAGAASMALLVGVVLPRFAAILADLGQRLPTTTHLVLTAGDLVRAAALPSLVLAALVAAAWRAWVASESGRQQWHEMLLSIPLVGTYRRSAATARAANALAALLESGVPISPALLHAAGAAGDAAVEARIRLARNDVVTGSRLASALSAHGAVTPTAIRLVKAGEETGRLAAMLAHAARLEGERSAELVRRAVRLLEPGLVLVFGGIIALVAAALLQAVYSVRPTP